MNGSLPELPGGSPQALTPQVCCDLCEGVMSIPPGAIQRGRIVGLLVCTQCIEDQLEAQAYAN